MIENIQQEPQKIRQMFSRVSDRYDMANTVLSMGVHHLWKNRLVRLANLQSEERALDVATGTGDLAIKLKKSAKDTQVIGIDSCKEMIALAPQKARDHQVSIQFLSGDAMDLPFSDSSFDVVTIAFGIRNVAHPLKALCEMARVLKPNGRLFILEFGQPSWLGLREIFDFYSTHILPKIGGWITGQPEAYKYLQSSSQAFPCRDEFLQLVDRTTSFSNLRYESLSGGIAYIYQGIRFDPRIS